MLEGSLQVKEGGRRVRGRGRDVTTEADGRDAGPEAKGHRLLLGPGKGRERHAPVSREAKQVT